VSSFKKKAIVATVASRVAFLSKAVGFHQSPLGIIDNKAVAQYPNLSFGRLNQVSQKMGILNLNKP